MKTLLLPVFGDDGDKAGPSAAFSVAQLFDGHIEFLHVRGDPAVTYAFAIPGDTGFGFAPPDLFGEFQKQVETRARRAKRDFEDFCVRERIPRVESPPGPGTISAVLREIVGDHVSAILARAVSGSRRCP